MAKNTTFPGYVKLPKAKLKRSPVTLGFNAQIKGKMGAGAKLEFFSLRLFTAPGELGKCPEISVTIRPEEWLDLIDAMKEEFEEVSKMRKKLDGM